IWSFYPASAVDWKKQDKRLKDMAWRNLALEARATGKDEDWIKSSNPRGITLNDWTIYMSYVYREEFQGPHDSLAQALNKDEPRGRLRAGGVGKNKTLVSPQDFDLVIV
ncbi:hypothetical protein LINPERPRIM_LOCUS20816, partial [Linum perenne]